MTSEPKSLRLLGKSLLATAVVLLLAVAATCLPAQASPPDSRQGSAPSATPQPQSNGPVDIPAALPRGKKLILTDGTFQLVREYQRLGDRVRYYSIERSAWEEIPASLVDWPATAKSEADEEARQKALVEKAKATKAAELSVDLEDIDKSIEVRPGVFLPDEKGFYVLDGNLISPVAQDKIDAHSDKGRTFEKVISGIAVLSDKIHLEMSGKHAKLRVHSAEPEFYFRPADGREPRLSLVRAEIKGDKRELLTAKRNITGAESYKSDDVSLQVWDAARGVYRFTVDRALLPGEYALLEMVTDGVAPFAWDFGVDADAKTPDPVQTKPKAP